MSSNQGQGNKPGHENQRGGAQGGQQSMQDTGTGAQQGDHGGQHAPGKRKKNGDKVGQGNQPGH